MVQQTISFISASGNIVSVEHDDETLSLDVGFLGSKYRYFEVPKEVADGFATAKSAGKYLNDNIKGRYKYERL